MRSPWWAGGSQKLFQAGEYHPITAFIDHGSLKDSQHRIEQPLRDLMRDAYGRAENNVDRIGFTIDNNPDLYGRARRSLKTLALPPIRLTRSADMARSWTIWRGGPEQGEVDGDHWRAAGQVATAREGGIPDWTEILLTRPEGYWGEAGTKAKRANAQQWMSILKGTPGVKADELNWLGVEDWLKEQNRPVTQQRAGRLHSPKPAGGNGHAARQRQGWGQWGD